MEISEINQFMILGSWRDPALFSTKKPKPNSFPEVNPVYVLAALYLRGKVGPLLRSVRRAPRKIEHAKVPEWGTRRDFLAHKWGEATSAAAVRDAHWRFRGIAKTTSALADRSLISAREGNFTYLVIRILNMYSNNRIGWQSDNVTNCLVWPFQYSTTTVKYSDIESNRSLQYFCRSPTLSQ